MGVIHISVPETTAQRFQALSEQQQTFVSQLVADCLAEPTSLTDVMDYISFKATQRGLTPENLQSLLDRE